MDIKELSLNPFIKLAKETALVSAGTEEKSNTMTVGWGGLGVLWGKNVVYIVIRESRYTKEFIDNGDTFSLAFLPEELKGALGYCGRETGRGKDKWAEAGLTPAFKDGVVYPAEANLTFICRKVAETKMTEDWFIDKEIMPRWYADNDMHVMYVGEILDVIGE